MNWAIGYEMKKTSYILAGILVVALLAGGVLWVKKNRPAGSAAVHDTLMKDQGPAGAPVQMVEYSDFQCPACQKVEPIIKQILSEPDFSGKIHFIYRHFPLPGHRWSGLAHQAAECAHQEKRFWEYHDRLYAEQTAWSVMDNPVETFIRYAKDFNIPLESFGLCLASPQIRDRVLEDKKKGDDLQVNSTPTFFINGERYVGQVELQLKGAEAIRRYLGLPPASPSAAASPAT